MKTCPSVLSAKIITVTGAKPIIAVTNRFWANNLRYTSSSWDCTIRLWDVKTGKEKSRLSIHTTSLLSVNFSPNGRILASGLKDSTIRLWDVETGKKIAVLSGHIIGVNSVSFSPDGRMLASGAYDDHIRLWDVKTGKEIAQFFGYKGIVWSVGFSPDGRTLVSGSDKHVVLLWDLSFLYDTCSIEEKIKEAEQKYNLKLVNLELQPIEPSQKFHPPRWPKTHPFHWLSKAESGDVEAMVQLGLCYDRDFDSLKTEKEKELCGKAMHWYQKAADLGNAYGKERLEFLKGWMERNKSEP